MDGPPEYPDVALTTPFTCWKTACTPQKHPPAKTAVSWVLFAGVDSSAAGLGRTTALLSPAIAKMIANSNKEETSRLKRDFDITILSRISLRGPPNVRVAIGAKVTGNLELAFLGCHDERANTGPRQAPFLRLLGQ